MLAKDIKVGDQYHHEGTIVYVVQDVTVLNGGVILSSVQYADGGYAIRSWPELYEVPLTRPDALKGV